MLKEPAPQSLAIPIKKADSPQEMDVDSKMNISFFPQKNHPISWSDSDVDKLLDFLNENFSEYREKKTDFYNKAAVLFEGISPMQIKNKFKKLFLRYRTILNEASQAGADYYNPWRYYEKIDRILRAHFGPDDFSQTVASEVGLGVPLSPPSMTGTTLAPQQQELAASTTPIKFSTTSNYTAVVPGGDTREKVMAFFNAGRRSTDVFIWTHTEVQRLLDCLEKHFDLYSRKKTDFYEKASQLLPGVTSLQINNKLKKMVRRYHDIRQSPTPNNNGAATWVYFKQLDHIFRSNHDGAASESDSNSSNVDLNHSEENGGPSAPFPAKSLQLTDSNTNGYPLFHHFQPSNVIQFSEKPSTNPMPSLPSTVEPEPSQSPISNNTNLPMAKRPRLEEQPANPPPLDLEDILRHPNSEMHSQIVMFKEREIRVRERALEIDREIRLKQLEFDREIRLRELELEKEIRLKDLEYKYLQK
ncbi:hypothetical protein K493DRAFT_363297 [Basidiobolus meristosporus CBS 931.73]|uniref:Myb-like domain-containing protein n=1 Tax=Basidiobolus meristosporus CBS 931.73 TaxID=1314790 RepID=A0A1Y1WVA4_9FUNG|nr:hypothetical protein K493DRAFT_363297 [Basidiobolus meristosporus CBS 931.73]|eukprot:ORX77489.1 hypothetical protein K493DRAFT_363297 [Basidiobolus meristosporus CBS 931.73]